MCPLKSTATIAEAYDRTLIYAHDKHLPAGTPRPCPTSQWPPENMRLLERYYNWLIQGGTAAQLTRIFYLPAANFIRWATVWIEKNSEQNKNQLQIVKMGIKRQVQVAAHTSAKIIQNSKGMLLRFSLAISLAGKSLQFWSSFNPVRPNYFLPFSTILALIVLKLR